MEGARYSPYKRNALAKAVRKGNIERVREIISSCDLSRSQEWSDALDGYVLLLTALQNKRADVAKLLLTNGSKVNKNHRKPCNTPLHYAVQNGDLEIVQMLLDRAADINVRSLKSKTALHIAVESGRMDIIGVLLNHGASVKISDINDMTPLHTAVRNGSADIAKLLLSRGANLNAKASHRIGEDEGKDCTPLHLAVQAANEEITKLLLSSGANVNAKRNDGISSLHIAAEKGYLRTVEHLLGHGADVNSTYSSTTRQNCTPLHLAVEIDAEEIVKLLLSKGANVNARGMYGITSLYIALERGNLQIAEHLLKSGASVNAVYTSPTQNGYTPLHCAVEKGSSDVAKFLLNRGANVNAKGRHGVTCLHIALENGYLQIAEHLLTCGASVKAVYTSATRGGYTPLHLAAEIDAGEITELLLSKGANVNAQGTEDITPLHIASRAGYLKIAERLLKRGADVHSASRSGQTPLYLAVENGHEMVVKLLVECEARVDAKAKNDKTILLLAVEKGKLTIVEQILKPCANLNNKSNSSVLNVAVRGCGAEYSKIVQKLLEYGFTVTRKDVNCMHAAIEKGYVGIVGELLKYVTDVRTLYNVTSRKRYIPLHVAIKHRHEEIAKLLISYGADVNAPDEAGKTPIFHAIENDDLKMTELLIANKVNVRGNPQLLNIAVKGDHREIVEVLLEHGADVNASDECGRTPMHFIVLDKENKRFGFLGCEGPRINTKGEVTTLLLSRGADPNIRIKNSMTVLHAAIDQGYVKVVEALLEYDTDINATYKNHVTPLHLAAKRGNEVITKMLLDKGAFIHAEDSSGETALHRATRRNHKGVVELLLKGGAKVDAATYCDLTTPLYIAVESGYLNIVELLLKFGAKVDSTIKHDVTTSLHNAAEIGHLKIVKLLLKMDASVDSTNPNGLTALHIATIKGRVDIITALLEHGSDVAVQSKGLYTPLDFAMDGIKLFRDLNYSSEYDDDYDNGDHDITTYINIAEILKRHMVKVKAVNLNAENDDVLLIKSDDEEVVVSDYPTDYERKILRVYSTSIRKERRLSRNNFQYKCEEEIARMRSKKFGNTNISFYDILTKDVSQLGMYARNENIIAAFRSDDYKVEFPIYASMVNNSFRKGEKKKELLEQCNKIFDLLFNDFPALPRDCTERILGYLKDEDLRALTDAGELIAHCQQS